MINRPSSSGSDHSRLQGWGDWILVVGLMVTVAGTTLGLGGFLAETMVVTAWAIFGLAALGGIFWALRSVTGQAEFNWAAWLPVPFLLYALASVLWIAPAKWLAWREWLLWLQMWLVFVLALHIGRGRRQTRVVVVTLTSLAVAGVAMAAYQRFTDPGWLMLGRKQAAQFFGRSSGMFGIPNSFAGLLELVIPVCLTLLFSRATRSWIKIVCVWLATLFIFALVLTGSRGGWVSLAFVLLLWPLLGGRDWRRKLTGLLVILLIATAGVVAAFKFSENFRLRFQPLLAGQFEPSRPLIWKAGFQIWRDYPIIGSGAASYNVMFDQYRPPGFLNEPHWTHNDYLNTLSDYGVIGFVLWAGAGVSLFVLGWRAVQRARREKTLLSAGFHPWKWRLGLFLGLLAYAFHLGVDFHTKLPALAFVFALMFGLLLRDDESLRVPVGARWPALVSALSLLAVAGWVADPLYRAEALRVEARRTIDRHAAKGRSDLHEIIPAAVANLERAVLINPANGQAWADLSYATVQNWHVEKGDLAVVGRRAEDAAERALQLCSINPHYWIRQGVALDMQARQSEGEVCFRRSLTLAPHTPAVWYYYAYHLQAFSARRGEALQALATCLTLDPSNAAAVTLRQQLIVRP